MRGLAGIFFCFVALSQVVACAPLTQLDDGRTSGLTAEGNALRLSVPLQGQATPVRFSYRPIKSCTFTEKTSGPTISATNRRLILSIRPISDKLQIVVVRDSDPPETYLINRSGHLYDFNAQNVLHPGNRVTTDNQATIARNNVSETSKAARAPTFHGAIHAINDFNLYVPEYTSGLVRPGQTVATIVTMDDLQPYASYRYMGTVDYQGNQVALLDLSRKMPGFENRGPIIVGFSLVDIRTSLPVLTVFDAGFHRTLERVSCDG